VIGFLFLVAMVIAGRIKEPEVGAVKSNERE
jgi:hypothetical protein